MKKQESDMQDNNQADDKLKGLADSLLNFEAEPPAGMWDRIEGGLLKRRRRMMIFRYSSIAASLILLLGFGVTYFTTDIFRSSGNRMISDSEIPSKAKTRSDSANTIIKYSPADNQSKVVSGKKTTTIIVGDTEGTSGKKTTSAIVGEASETKDTQKVKSSARKRRDEHERAVNQSTDSKSKSILPDVKDDHLAATTTEDDVQDVTREIIVPADPVLEGIDLAVIAPVNKYPEPVEDDYTQPGKYANDWSLAMGYGITSGADYTRDDEILNTRGSRYSPDDFSADLASQTSYFQEIENTVHDAPLSLGIIVDKSLTRRLSFTTGVTYTLLSFRVKTDELSPYYKKYRNELNYLGVPAGVRYKFLDRNKFNLYALQWIVLEKGVGGRWYVDTYTNDVITESESKQQSIRGFQVSSVTGVGGEVKISGKFYLFAQGGAQAFFLNKTQPYNIRSSQVAWPSVQTGLRINLD